MIARREVQRVDAGRREMHDEARTGVYDADHRRTVRGQLEQPPAQIYRLEDPLAEKDGS